MDDSFCYPADSCGSPVRWFPLDARVPPLAIPPREPCPGHEKPVLDPPADPQ